MSVITDNFYSHPHYYYDNYKSGPKRQFCVLKSQILTFKKDKTIFNIELQMPDNFSLIILKVLFEQNQCYYNGQKILKINEFTPFRINLIYINICNAFNDIITIKKHTNCIEKLMDNYKFEIYNYPDWRYKTEAIFYNGRIREIEIVQLNNNDNETITNLTELQTKKDDLHKLMNMISNPSFY